MSSEEINLEDYEISAHIATTGVLIIIVIQSEKKLQFQALSFIISCVLSSRICCVIECLIIG